MVWSLAPVLMKSWTFVTPRLVKTVLWDTPCGIKLLYPDCSGKLFPITANAPKTLAKGPVPFTQQPAVHIELGIAIFWGATWEGNDWDIGFPVAWTVGGLPAWLMMTSDIPVIRYRVPPFGTHLLCAYFTMRPSYFLHEPLLKFSTCGTALV